MDTKLQATTRKRKVREAFAAQRKAERGAKRNATETMKHCLGSVTEMIDSNGCEYECDIAFADRIHQSHRIVAVHLQQDAFFCEKCGSYNSGGPLPNLAVECQGQVPKYRQYGLSLLRAGIVPRRGVKLPANF